METDSGEQAEFALKLIGGPLAGKVVSVRQNKVRIGRTRLSSLVVKDPSVSEKHAEIALVDGQWRIRDLGSTNGTFLNGVRVSDVEVTVQDGDKLQLGTDSVAIVQISSGRNDDATIQQIIEIECERLEKQILDHSRALCQELKMAWEAHKARITANL